MKLMNLFTVAVHNHGILHLLFRPFYDLQKQWNFVLWQILLVLFTVQQWPPPKKMKIISFALTFLKQVSKRIKFHVTPEHRDKVEKTHEVTYGQELKRTKNICWWPCAQWSQWWKWESWWILFKSWSIFIFSFNSQMLW